MNKSKKDKHKWVQNCVCMQLLKTQKTVLTHLRCYQLSSHINWMASSPPKAGCSANRHCPERCLQLQFDHHASTVCRDSSGVTFIKASFVFALKPQTGRSTLTKNAEIFAFLLLSWNHPTEMHCHARKNETRPAAPGVTFELSIHCFLSEVSNTFFGKYFSLATNQDLQRKPVTVTEAIALPLPVRFLEPWQWRKYISQEEFLSGCVSKQLQH